MSFKPLRQWHMPRSLLGRMLLLTLLAILLAQTLSSAIWLSQLRTTQLEGLVNSARSMAHSMNATGATMPEAVVMATVAEPVAIRISAANTQPMNSGDS